MNAAIPVDSRNIPFEKLVSRRSSESSKRVKRQKIQDLFEYHQAHFFSFAALPHGNNVKGSLFYGLQLTEYNCTDFKNFFEIFYNHGLYIRFSKEL